MKITKSEYAYSSDSPAKAWEVKPEGFACALRFKSKHEAVAFVETWKEVENPFENKIELPVYSFDDGETIIGKDSFRIHEANGRALIAPNNPSMESAENLAWPDLLQRIYTTQNI